jgi:hypothetical protein
MLFNQKLLLVSAVFIATLTPFHSASVEAKAGATCAKVGQIRTFGGVQHVCQVGKGRKAKNTWVATGKRSTPVAPTTTSTTVPVVTSATWDCGPTFANSQYPAFRLDDLLLKPKTQSVLTYLKTPTCQVNVQWTPSNDAALNATRNISVCWEVWTDWPNSNSVSIDCTSAYFIRADGRFALSWWKEYQPDIPYYGFILLKVKGYLGDSATAVWESERHLIMYDIDANSMGSSTSHARWNAVGFTR